MATDSSIASAEVLPPSLSRGQARSLESSAKRHWRAAARNALVFAAELRRLQDGGAHFVRGFENFGHYAEHTFEGLTANAAKQLSRQGGVLLTLQRAGRVDLQSASAVPVATTALRALSVVHNSFGEQAMLGVYDRAIELRPGRVIVEQTVKAAVRELHAGAAPAALGARADVQSEPVKTDLDEDGEDQLLSEELSELVDRLDVLRRHVDDFRLNVEDPVLARRELRNVVEEIEQVKAATAAAYGDGR